MIIRLVKSLSGFLLISSIFVFTLLVPKQVFAGCDPQSGAGCSLDQFCDTNGVCRSNRESCDRQGGEPCPAGYTCVNHLCKGGGGEPPGGGVCSGCKSGSDGASSLAESPVQTFTVSHASATSASISWQVYPNTRCQNRSRIAIFIGRDKNMVDNLCLIGATQSNPNGGDIPIGCDSIYYTSGDSGTLNTAYTTNTNGQIFTFSPSTTYYVNVVSQYFWTDRDNTDLGTWCGGPGTQPWMGLCTLSPGSATMAVGESKTFTTNVDTGATTYTPSPHVNNVSFSYAGAGSMTVSGYNFGSGSDRVVVTLSPVVSSVQITTHKECDPECRGGKCCGQVRDGVNVFGSGFGPGPDYVYQNGTYLGSYPVCPGYTTGCLRLDGYMGPTDNMTVAAGNPTPVNGVYPVTNGGSGLNSDSITINGYIYDYSSITVSYSSQTTSIPPTSKVDNVAYSVSPTYLSITSTNPDPTSPYQGVVKAIASTYPSSTPLTSDVHAGGIATPPACTATSAITVTGQASTDPWWQVKDSDIQSNGYLSSKVPAGSFFGLPGLGGYPGVVAYGTTTNLTGTNVSETSKWLANSSWTPKGIYNYAYFAGQIPADVTPTPVDSSNLSSQIMTTGTEQYGYYWYKYDGAAPANAGAPLSLSSPISIGTKKVILLVDNADFNIGKTINGITKGQGFFLVIVKGNIKVDPGVGGGVGPNLEGLYVADNTFQTGGLPKNQDGTGNDIQLRVRGSIVGYGGVTLQRSLAGAGNVTNPAEYLEYAPDQIMLFPSKLGVRKIVWKEVAP